MALSFVVYTGTGASTFAVPFPYITKDHVTATVNGVAATFSWPDATHVTITPAPQVGDTIRIARSSSPSVRLADFQDAQTLTAADLDLAVEQNFYLSQEAFDAVSTGVGGGDMLRAFNLSDVYDAAAARANIGALAASGGSVSGPLYGTGAFPSLPQELANKAYVDDMVASVDVSAFGVSTFNTRTGAVTLTSADVTTALGHTPLNTTTGGNIGGPCTYAGGTTLPLHLVTKGYLDQALDNVDVPVALGYTPVNKAGDTITGALTVSGAMTLGTTPTLGAHAATKSYVDAAVLGSVTGVASFNTRTGAVTLTYADTIAALGFTPVNPSGGTMTGYLFLNGNPTSNLHAATKQYVDAAVAAGGGAVNTALAYTWTGVHKWTGGTTDPSMPVGATQNYSGRMSRTTSNTNLGEFESALLLDQKSTAGSKAFSWTLWSRLDHYSNTVQSLPSQPFGADGVSFYAQANKYGAAPTFAAVLEVRDASGNYTQPVYGCEIDLCSDGSDPYENRFGMAIFFGANTNTFGSGSATMATDGIKIAPFVDARNSLRRGIKLEGTILTGIHAQCNGQHLLKGIGSYSVAAIDLTSTVNAPVGLALGAGSVIKYASGTGNGGNTSWYSGAITPAYVGAIKIMIDGAVLYLPVCSNHP